MGKMGRRCKNCDHYKPEFAKFINGLVMTCEISFPNFEVDYKHTKKENMNNKND